MVQRWTFKNFKIAMFQAGDESRGKFFNLERFETSRSSML